MLRILTFPLRLIGHYLRKQLLFARIQSRNYDKRFDAVYALHKEFGPKAVPGLIYILRHPNGEVRADVAYTLELITGKYNGDGFEKWQKWRKKNQERDLKKYCS